MPLLGVRFRDPVFAQPQASIAALGSADSVEKIGWSRLSTLYTGTFSTVVDPVQLALGGSVRPRYPAGRSLELKMTVLFADDRALLQLLTAAVIEQAAASNLWRRSHYAAPLCMLLCLLYDLIPAIPLSDNRSSSRRADFG